VRLSEGDFARETVYGDDPVAVAEGYVAAGAQWVHVVDLDAARTGEATNRSVVARIAQVSGIRVQTGGGVRSLAAAAALLDAGVARVVVGTAAVERPELVAHIAQRWPGGVAVGLDHRDGEVRLRGWTAGGGRRVLDVVPEALANGAVAVIVTDIGRDGMLAGPDVAGLAALLEATGAPIIASGGVASVDDLSVLATVCSGSEPLAAGPVSSSSGPVSSQPERASGRPGRPGGAADATAVHPSARHHHRLIGVIVGKALYEGRFTVAQALAAVGTQEDR
jgi:phosphoribosylformimino-5-aminoimidazole carboxamide ribotide isomerase